MNNRIFFPGNPWPDGHAIKELFWSARLDPETGLWFDLHLESENYYAEDSDQDTAYDDAIDNDWESKLSWSNFHSCTLSSTYWDNIGFQVASQAAPLDMAVAEGQVFSFDNLPVTAEHYERAFGIYLLGHDGVADHRVCIKKQPLNQVFSLKWSGRIALEYNVGVGLAEFDQEFQVNYDSLTFSGIELPDGFAANEAISIANELVSGLGELEFVAREDADWLIPM